MKNFLAAVLTALIFGLNLFAAQARNIELVDIPTGNSMLKGEVRYNSRFYPGGGILNKLYVGIFDRLMIGGAFNVNNLIGSGNVEFVIPPKFLAKVRFTDDDGAVPAIAVGYEGERYMDVQERGAFLAITKEAAFGNVYIQLSGAAYTNTFRPFGRDIDIGAGLALAITREFTISAEYDSIILDERGHINVSVGYYFDPIQIDIVLKYGMSDYDIRQARLLKITYISYF